MRYVIIVLILLLASGCSAKSVPDDEPVTTRTGIIKSKHEANINQVEKNTKNRTSVYGSVSSGGGVSIGLGFLLGNIGSGKSEPDPLRYEIELDDGEIMTIYQSSRDFEIDDCVRINIHPNAKSHPPTMQRSSDGCSE